MATMSEVQLKFFFKIAKFRFDDKTNEQQSSLRRGVRSDAKLVFTR